MKDFGFKEENSHSDRIMNIFHLFFFFFFSLHLQAALTDSLATAKDSIAYKVHLEGIVVTGENVIRKDGHVVYLPDKKQRKHASNSMDLLDNLMIPGLEINKFEAVVTYANNNVELYIDGRKASAQEIYYLRAKDIANVEYHDTPIGQYSNDYMAVNFITKQYKFGGYVQSEAMQTIGYGSGNLGLSAKFDRGKSSYTLMSGGSYSNYGNSLSKNTEIFNYPSGPVERASKQSDSKFEQYTGYLQFIHQHRKSNNMFQAVYSIVGNNTAKDKVWGEYSQSADDVDYSVDGNKFGLYPSVTLFDRMTFGKDKSLTVNLSTGYSYNEYNRNRKDALSLYFTEASEDKYTASLTMRYNARHSKGNWGAALRNYFVCYNSNYGGSYKSWSHFSSLNSMASVNYDMSLVRNVRMSAVGSVNMFHYSVHNYRRTTKVYPYSKLTFTYRKDNDLLSWNNIYTAGSLPISMLCNTSVVVDDKMDRQGNPELEVERQYYTQLLYSKTLQRFAITASAAYSHKWYFLVPVYLMDNSQRLNISYSDDARLHSIQARLNASYKVGQNLRLSASADFMRHIVYGARSAERSTLFCRLVAQWYLGDFALRGYVSSPQKALMASSVTFVDAPVNYGFSVMYRHDNLSLSLEAYRPFSHAWVNTKTSSELYSCNGSNLSVTSRDYIRLGVVYSLDFGRKTSREENKVSTNTNSTLLGS